MRTCLILDIGSYRHKIVSNYYIESSLSDAKDLGDFRGPCGGSVEGLRTGRIEPLPQDSGNIGRTVIGPFGHR